MPSLYYLGPVLACLLVASCHEQPRRGVVTTTARALSSVTPALGPETGMDKPLLGPGGINQGYATVAYDGKNFLVVWKDFRRGMRNDVYATRVDSTGKVLDPYGIAVATTPGSKDRPQVSFDGVNYLVVWEDFRGGKDFDIYGARVTPGGAVLDQNGIAICTSSQGQYRPVAAHHGGKTLVVWEDQRGITDFDIMGARLDSAGKVLDVNGFGIATGGNHTKHPTAAGGPGGFLVAWTNSHYKTNNIFGTLVSAAGKVTTLNGASLCTTVANRAYPWVAHDGTGFLVVWQDLRHNAAEDIFGARVSSAGVLQDPKGFAISTASKAQEFPVVAPHFGGFLGVWQDRRSSNFSDIHGAKVKGLKVLAAPTISGAQNYQIKPYVAQGGTNSLVVWEDLRDGNSYSIFGARVSPAGAVQDPKGIPISTTANRQTMAAVGAGAGQYLVVWQDRRSVATSPISQIDIFGVRLSSAGAVLDPAGIQITMAMDDQKEPAVAFGGGQYLVVWQDGRTAANVLDVYGARISAAGKVLDASGIPISSGKSERSAPAVAYDGTRFLVVWQDRRAGTTYDIYGARVDATGAVLDPAGFAVAKATAQQRYPAVAHDGARFLVAWQDRSAGNNDILGARVDSAGKVLDATPLTLSAASGQQERPAVTRAPGGFFAAWEDNRGADRDIYGARVTGAGVVQDSAGIAVAKLSGQQQRPVVSHDGNLTLVTWQDANAAKEPQVRGTLVDATGKVLSATGFLVADRYSRDPAVAAGAKHQFFVAYHRFDPSTTYGATRIRGRLVTWKAQGIGCTGDGQCKSGFCVDGVCCDSACGGGKSGDCQACSVTAGAAKDGTCGLVKKGYPCRPAAGACDQTEGCDGASTACPANGFMPLGTVCPGGACVTGGLCKPKGTDLSVAKPDAAMDGPVKPADLPPPLPEAAPDGPMVKDLPPPDQQVVDQHKKPDMVAPDMAVPDLSKPDATLIDSAGPDKAKPAPDLQVTPDLPPADTTAPDSQQPDTRAPDVFAADWRPWDRTHVEQDSYVPPGKPEPEGCSCRVGPGGGSGWLFGLLLPLLVRRRVGSALRNR